MLRWCEWASVDDIIGLARNPRLEALGAPLMAEAEVAYAAQPQKQRRFAWLDYAAGSWDRDVTSLRLGETEATVEGEFTYSKAGKRLETVVFRQEDGVWRLVAVSAPKK